MSKVLVNKLIVRAAPSNTSEEIAQYNAGDIIHSGDSLIENEEGIWLRYTGQSGNKRYVMVYDKDNAQYVDVAANRGGCACGGCHYRSLLRQNQFPDS